MCQSQIEILQRALKREKTARKAAEQILEEKSKELYYTNQKLKDLLGEKSSQLEGVFENILDAYVIIDLKGNIIKFNESAIKLFGYDIRKEKVNITNLIYKDDFKYAISSFEKLKSTGVFKNYEIRLSTKSKEVKWVQINASIIFDKNEQPVAAQGILRDVTNQKNWEQKLIESENRLSTLVSNLDIGIVLENENQKIELTNNKFCEFFNTKVDPEYLKGRDCMAAAHNFKLQFKNSEKFLNKVQKINADKIAVFGEELETFDGKILECNYLPIKYGDTNKGYLWTFKDVTLYKRYSKSLKEQKQKYYNIIANMNLGLLEVNIDGEVLMVNQSFSEISGYSEKELLGLVATEVFSMDGRNTKAIQNEINKREKGQSNSYEVKVKTKFAEEKYWLVSVTPNLDFEGNQIGSIAVTLDITNFKKLQNQKERLLSKLAKSNDELQEYAHIVSHDLKSPLRSIDALVSWLKDDNKGKLDELSMRNFALIETTLEKMEQLITDVLNYSSIGSDIAKKTDVDLNDLVNQLVDIMYVPKHIEVRVLNTLPHIKGDQTKLQQLFQNLISNAVKFIDKNLGEITIDFEDLKSHYKFKVQDNGIGIDKNYHDKIFKIFHSLRKSKDSSGIGLSIVKKIVDLHEGEVWLDSIPNVGTIFYFTLKKE